MTRSNQSVPIFYYLEGKGVLKDYQYFTPYLEDMVNLIIVASLANYHSKTSRTTVDENNTY